MQRTIRQNRGIRLFLQIHDFAEDGRPHLYYPGEYPADCHYGVINSRDYKILLNAGLEQKGLHKLFNMVNPFDGTRQDRGEKNVVLYPVRAIRRKNIGEAILLSLFFKNGATLAITRATNHAGSNCLRAQHRNTDTVIAVGYRQGLGKADSSMLGLWFR